MYVVDGITHYEVDDHKVATIIEVCVLYYLVYYTLTVK